MKFLLFFLCYNNEEKKNFSFFEGGIFMWTFYEKNKQAIHDIVLLIAAVLGCFLFFRYLFRIFLPFLIGWLLSLLFNPLADRLQKFHIPRGISAIIGILLLFALLGLLGFWSGTGLIAKHIVRSADHIEATDASAKLTYFPQSCRIVAT